jgi:hypothetical protein
VEGIVKWVAVAAVVFVAWRWLGGMLSGSANAQASFNGYVSEYPNMYGGNPGVVAMYGPFVNSPEWGRVQARVRPRRSDTAGWRAAY